jgi:hypothetical protein
MVTLCDWRGSGGWSQRVNAFLTGELRRRPSVADFMVAP